MTDSLDKLRDIIIAEAATDKGVGPIVHLLMDEHSETVADFVENHAEALLVSWVKNELALQRRKAKRPARRDPREILAKRAAAGTSVFDLSFMEEDRRPDLSKLSDKRFLDQAKSKLFGDETD